MGGKLNCYDFGGGGVNRVKNPLQLADTELFQSQNAEYVADGTPGGQGSMSKRGGIQALTSALNSGAEIRGIIGLPLQTTFTRTLYAPLGTEAADTFAKTTDGTTWSVTSTPLAGLTGLTAGQLGQAGDVAHLQKVTTRMVGFGTQLVYPGSAYTVGSGHPTLVRFAGTAESAVHVLYVPPGPVTSSGFADVVVDMLVANNTIYMSVSCPGGTAGNSRGYVVALDIETGVMSQVGQHFGSTGYVGGGPTALCWYQGKLWVGTGSPSAPTGGILNAVPGVDATWTQDVAASGESICSMAVFQGDLFVGFEGDAVAASIKRRTAATGAYANVITGGTAGGSHFSALIVYNDELYAVEYNAAATDVLHIVKSSDGTTWGTDADLDASFSGVHNSAPFNIGSAVVYNGDLYIAFRSWGVTGLEANYLDGFIMRKSAGTWTKVYTGNVQGSLAVLLERS